MIKKRYLMILPVAVVTILLGSVLYSNLVLAQKGKEATEVDVINLPLDEQGNLRIKTMVQPSKIMLVYNQSLTVPSDLYNFKYLTSFNTSGFKYVWVMAKAQGTWLVGEAVIDIYIFDNNFGIQTLVTHLPLDTSTGGMYRPSWGTAGSDRWEIHSSSIDLYLHVYNSDVGFDGLLTIAVYLTN